MKNIESFTPENTCCDMRDSWNTISKFSSDFGVIVHGPGGCENEFPYYKTNHALSFCTYLNDLDITIGSGYQKLHDLVQTIIDKNEIKVLFILGTCSSELIGDDILNIRNEFKGASIKIIPINTSGMRGGGYHFTKFSIYTELFGSFKKELISNNLNSNSINIFFEDSIITKEFEAELKGFCSEIGFDIAGFFSTSLDYKNVKSMLSASKNYYIGSEEEFIEVLNVVKGDFGIPFKILAMPIGFENINKFYSSIFLDFQSEKKDYVVKYLKMKKDIEIILKNKEISSIFNKYDFSTNSRIYNDLLNNIGINSILCDINQDKKDTVNFSHKFNRENKILISEKGDIGKIIPAKRYACMHRYLGFAGIKLFIDDVLSHEFYMRFLKRYNKYLKYEN